MFDYIQGVVDSVTKTRIVLDLHGAGFDIVSDAFSRGAAVIGETMRLYTQLRVSDDRLQLYGFGSRAQRDLFIRLTGVSGIGPRVAMGILSVMTASEIAAAVIGEDEKAFQNVPGVGKKTAQRLILDLKGKVQMPEGETPAVPKNTGADTDAAAEAAEALEGLGYTAQEAAAAVAAVHSLADTAEDIVRLALKRFGMK